MKQTLEESITDLIAISGKMSYHQYPLRLYQIGNKFRDEMNSRMGLIRAKEFIMKDLYTFDLNREKSLETYEQVNEAYRKLLSTIGVPFVKVEADTGEMGGSLSHEYHYVTDVGENSLLKCNKCNHAINIEMNKEMKLCTKCHSDDVQQIRGLEVIYFMRLHCHINV